MTDELVRYDQAQGLATLTMQDADRGNPLDLAMLAALEAGAAQARADDVRVVVLRATGRSFCVGGDLAAVGDDPDPGRRLDLMAESVHRFASELARMDAVVVSAVQGVAAGAGVALCAAADVVLAAQSARFTLAYTKIGFTPDGGTSLLVASLGLHRMLQLALLNPVLTAQEAQAAGLVAQVHPDDELAAAVDRVADTLLAGSRSAQVGAKRLLRGQGTPHPEQAMRLETLGIRAAAASPDGREGVASFLAKRRPDFPSTWEGQGQTSKA